MSRKDKFRQINKEAKACGIDLLLIIVFWVIAGFGVDALKITVFHTPLWAITGCVGTWVFSVVLVIIMVKKVFKDFNLDEDEEDEK